MDRLCRREGARPHREPENRGLGAGWGSGLREARASVSDFLFKTWAWNAWKGTYLHNWEETEGKHAHAHAHCTPPPHPPTHALTRFHTHTHVPAQKFPQVFLKHLPRDSRKNPVPWSWGGVGETNQGSKRDRTGRREGRSGEGETSRSGRPGGRASGAREEEEGAQGSWDVGLVCLQGSAGHCGYKSLIAHLTPRGPGACRNSALPRFASS